MIPSPTTADETFALNDHELFQLIRNRVNQKPSIPMTQIAQELGTDIDTLCAFIMLYREPQKGEDNSKGGPIPKKGWDILVHEQRYAAWKRQHEGAVVTLSSPQVVNSRKQAATNRKAGYAGQEPR